MSSGFDMTCKLTPESQARFREALDAVKDQARKSMPEFLAECAFVFAREAYARTKKGKASVDEKVKGPHRNAIALKGTYLWTWVKTSEGYKRLPMPANWAKANGLTRVGRKRVRFVPSSWTGNKRQVRNRGFARAGWIGVINKLGKRIAGDGDSAADAQTAQNEFADVIKQQSADSASVSISNSVPPAGYLQKRDVIMQRAFSALTGNLERMKETHSAKLQQSWAKRK